MNLNSVEGSPPNGNFTDCNCMAIDILLKAELDSLRNLPTHNSTLDKQEKRLLVRFSRIKTVGFLVCSQVTIVLCISLTC